MNPILKWVGGKRGLLPELRKHIQLDRAAVGRFEKSVRLDREAGYFEPFLGGGAVFFDLAPSQTPYASISDTNPHLINLYNQVRDDVSPLVQVLTDLQAEREAVGDDRAFFLTVRQAFNLRAVEENERSLLTAAAFIIINRLGFNGLWRVNRKGLCNVPPGKFKAAVDIVRADDLRAASLALQNAVITCADYETALERYRPLAGDVVYFDPPYIPASATSDFTGYTADGFDMDAQKVLAITARDLVARGVRVILSNSDTDLTREIYRNMIIDGRPAFTLHAVQARRAINCVPGKRGAVGELIIVGRMP